MDKRFRCLLNGAGALLLLVTAPPAFAQGITWKPITGDIQWSCGIQVETWATWQAEYVDGEATGATTAYQQHTAGICPSAGTRWETTIGNIAWPCADVETWETWQAEYVNGQATGATRDFQSVASGDCPNSASGGATPPLATLTLPFAPYRLSLGPATGDLAANGSGGCVVVLGSKLAQTIPLCDFIAWVPGSRWVVHNELSPPTSHGGGVKDVVAVPYAGGTAGAPVTIPCANGLPGSVQPISGPAVAYVCDGVLNILALREAGGTPKTYGFLTGRESAPLLIDPTGTDAAWFQPNGEVNVYRLADGSELPGTYMAGSPAQAAWSNNGTLALINASGVLTVWRPGSSVVSVATPQHELGYRLLWKPDGSGVLALATLSTVVPGLAPGPPGGVAVDPNGTVQTFAPALPQADYVLALTPDGKDLWYGPYPDGYTAGAYTMSEAPIP